MEGIEPYIEGMACRAVPSPPPAIARSYSQATPNLVSEDDDDPQATDETIENVPSTSYSYEGAMSKISQDAGQARPSMSATSATGDAATSSLGSLMLVLGAITLAGGVAYMRRDALQERFFPSSSPKAVVLAQFDGRSSVSSAAPTAKPRNDIEHAKPQRAATASGPKTKRKWKVTLDLGGNPWSVAVAKGSASGVDDLKQAIYEACLANIGADQLPAEWLDGDLDDMQVQFLDVEVRHPQDVQQPPHAF